MKRAKVRRLKINILRDQIDYFENFEKLYGPIIKELNHNDVYGPIEFSKKYILRSTLNRNYVPLTYIKNNYIPKSELPNYIKKYETKKHNKLISNKALRDSLDRASHLLNQL